MAKHPARPLAVAVRRADEVGPRAQGPYSADATRACSVSSCLPDGHPERARQRPNTWSRSSALTAVASTGPSGRRPGSLEMTSGPGGEVVRRAAVRALARGSRRAGSRPSGSGSRAPSCASRQPTLDLRERGARDRGTARPGRSPACGGCRRCGRSRARGRRRASSSSVNQRSALRDRDQLARARVVEPGGALARPRRARARRPASPRSRRLTSATRSGRRT